MHTEASDTTDLVDLTDFEDDFECMMWNNEFITANEWDRRVLNGCALCTDNTVSDEEVYPINQDQYICSVCATTPYGRDLMERGY